jgi:hypothetical protein
MQARLLSGATSPVLELIGSISSLQDSLALVSASFEMNTHNILLRSEQLPPEFFDLQTGFAGEFVQKLVNYRLRVACVFGDKQAFSERFAEYIREGRKGQHFRTFAVESEAVSWLDAQ